MSKTAEDHRPRLGRGLAALLGAEQEIAAAPAVPQGHRLRRVPVESCRPNPRNPRKTFEDDDLDDLAASIRTRGVLQPIVVRTASGEGQTYEIIAGERRWRAAQRANIHDIPIIVVEADDKLALELAIIENVQRSDLNPVEEARGYASLMAQHGYAQADLAETIGKSRSHVTNTLRLLKLPLPVLDLLASGRVSAGHARALLSVPNPERTAQDIVSKGLSVRAVEREAAQAAKPKSAAVRASVSADVNTKALAETLSQQTGLRIAIERRGEKGRVTIEFNTLEQFDHVFEKLERTLEI